jgi:hypothetical protein
MTDADIKFKNETIFKFKNYIGIYDIIDQSQ